MQHMQHEIQHENALIHDREMRALFFRIDKPFILLKPDITLLSFDPT